jgi:hypothetical protein
MTSGSQQEDVRPPSNRGAADSEAPTTSEPWIGSTPTPPDSPSSSGDVSLPVSASMQDTAGQALVKTATTGTGATIRTTAEALQWLAKQDGGRVKTTISDLARRWGWPRTTLRRRLKSWSEDGTITVAAAANGRLAITIGPGKGHGRPAAAANGQAELATATGQDDLAAAGRGVLAAGLNQIACVSGKPVGGPASNPLRQIQSVATPAGYTGLVGANTDATGSPDAAADAPIPGMRGHFYSDAIAYLAAVSLAVVTASFSVGGMTEMFPGYADGVMVLAATMEATKLVAVGWLTRNWLSTGLVLRAVLIVPIASFAAINAAGLYGRLVEAHVVVSVAATSSIEERLGAVDARIDAQIETVARIDRQIGEFDAAIGKMTENGRPRTALDAIASQRKPREGLNADRHREEAILVGLRSDRSQLEGERQRAVAANGPAVYLAATLGVPVEVTFQWLILMIALTCDPAAIALTVAASRPKYPGPDQITVGMQERDVFSARRLFGVLLGNRVPPSITVAFSKGF